MPNYILLSKLSYRRKTVLNYYSGLLDDFLAIARVAPDMPVAELVNMVDYATGELMEVPGDVCASGSVPPPVDCSADYPVFGE